MMYTATEAFEAPNIMELSNVISHFLDDLYKRHTIVRVVHSYTTLMRPPHGHVNERCFQTMIIYEYGTM
jgi:hypothetical protein